MTDEKKMEKPEEKVTSSMKDGSSSILGSEKSPIYIDNDDTFEALLKTYEHTQHWITLADTKAGLVLTISGVLAGFMLQQLVVWKNIALAAPVMTTPLWGIGLLMVAYFLFQAVSFFYTIGVFFPRVLNVDYRKTRHVFNVGVAQAFPNPDDQEKFWEEYKNLNETDLKREYAYQLHTDSIVCSRKYKSLQKSLRFLIFSICLSFGAFIFLAAFFK